MNLWHELPPGPNAPEVLYTIVEIPKGSRNKYEYHKQAGIIKLDRVLYSSLYYPGDYGLIPRTHYDDGDPLDIIVMINEPTFPGCIIEVRPIGLFRMLDRGVPDDKILGVPYKDPLYRDYHDLGNVPKHFLDEVGHFFSVYKDLEGARVEVIGWEDVDSAYERIRHSIQLYQSTFQPPTL